MSIESAILSFVFNFDNWFKEPFINLHQKKHPDVITEKDIIFSNANPAVCKADLHYKENNGEKVPVLVNVHGGGWIIGDKRNSSTYCITLADDADCFVMNINYGMPAKDVPFMFEKNDPKANHSPDYLWPYPIQTHFLALKWLEKNAEKYNLDLDNVYVSGDSAGAHMTGVVAAAFCSDEYNKALELEMPSFAPRGYIMNCGLYNVDFYNKVPIGRCMMRKFTGLDDTTQHPLHKYLNPGPYINTKANHVLVCRGMIDVATLTQSTGLVKQLKKAGVDYKEYVGRALPNSFHDFMLLAPTKASKKCMKYTAEWMKKNVNK